MGTLSLPPKALDPKEWEPVALPPQGQGCPQGGSKTPCAQVKGKGTRKWRERLLHLRGSSLCIPIVPLLLVVLKLGVLFLVVLL